MTEHKPSRSDRLDPGGETRRLAEGLAALASPPWSWFLRGLGVGASDLRQAKNLLAQHGATFGAMDDIADALASHGWVFFELSPATAYTEAAALVHQGLTEQAEEHIVESWNEQDALLLRMSVHRVGGLYRALGAEYEDPDTPDIGHARAVLIDEAIESHRAGHYAAAINLALAQIDGIVADFDEGGHLFFSRDRQTGEPRANVSDETTLAGHPEALLALAKLMTQRCDSTEVAGRLLRHGIMHGRELVYGTLRNSTQALATLLAVITWAQPVARARIDAAQAEREARYAGTDERDVHGRRLWRAGFNETKSGLEKLANLQDRFYERHGRYARSIDEIDPSEILREDFPQADTTTSDDGDLYRAWSATGSNYVFGLAGQPGDALRWRYAGEDAPGSGPGADAELATPSRRSVASGLVGGCGSLATSMACGPSTRRKTSVPRRATTSRGSRST